MYCNISDIDIFELYTMPLLFVNTLLRINQYCSIKNQFSDIKVIILQYIFALCLTYAIKKSLRKD